MRRTVKAWFVLLAFYPKATPYLCRSRAHARREERRSRLRGEGGGRVVPCTITYDDGRRAKPRKAGGRR